jgi:hypothetical protein
MARPSRQRGSVGRDALRRLEKYRAPGFLSVKEGGDEMHSDDSRGGVIRYGSYAYGWSGYEYKSSTTIGGWPIVHVCAGIDPVTMRPRIAKGVVAIGNIAVGMVAVGGLACGLFAVGGASIGLLLAVGGAAVGLGVSVGGFAVGSIAIGGVAVGFVYAIGGGAFGPALAAANR